MNKGYIYNSKIGEIIILEDEKGITDINLMEKANIENFEISKSENINSAIIQLEEYFLGRRKEFDLKLSLQGTDFQKKVYKAIRKIHYGETRSYKQIAESIGNVNASRAVGNANNKNRILFVIPCHRVMGSNGKLVGYSGGIEIKEYLLNLEKNNK